MLDLTDLPRDASQWERELFGHLTGHAQREGELLQAYVDAAETTSSEALRYVVQLLAEDERRHHRQMAELAQSLLDGIELKEQTPPVPWLDFHKADHEQLLEITRRLIDNEEHDLRSLKQLAKLISDMNDTSLWGLMVATMRHDTEKHLMILKFVERQVRRSA